MVNWTKTLYEADRTDQRNKQGMDKPYASYVDSVSGETEKVVIRNWAANGREVTVSHPFISSASWIRALPEAGAQYLTATRADDNEPQLFATISKGNESRVDAYNKQLGVYRGLTPGEIEISSNGIAQNFFGSRTYNSSRAGTLLRVMDQDNMSILDRSPMHTQKFLNNTAGTILDESRIGIVSRPKNTWFNFYPKVNSKFLAEEYINLLNPAKASPISLFTSHRGHVIDLKGREIKHKKTSLPLRLLQNYYAIDDTYTSFEIDNAGNYSTYLAQAAAEGIYTEIPNGHAKWKVKKDVGWDIDGNKNTILKGSESKDISGSKNTTITKSYKLSVADKASIEVSSDGTTTIDVGPGLSTIKFSSSGEISLTATTTVKIKAPKIELNGSASGITTMDSHMGVIDFITGAPCVPSTTVFADI